mmetsp:Transcript_32357/g.64115  ORF Transcript_32357/g.64115 Transcript_32357/m.64115 type:complete len:235 (+) Transcript_32357:566-1270(+)
MRGRGVHIFSNTTREQTGSERPGGHIHRTIPCFTGRSMALRLPEPPRWERQLLRSSPSWTHHRILPRPPRLPQASDSTDPPSAGVLLPGVASQCSLHEEHPRQLQPELPRTCERSRGHSGVDPSPRTVQRELSSVRQLHRTSQGTSCILLFSTQESGTPPFRIVLKENFWSAKMMLSALFTEMGNRKVKRAADNFLFSAVAAYLSSCYAKRDRIGRLFLIISKQHRPPTGFQNA